MERLPRHFRSSRVLVDSPPTPPYHEYVPPSTSTSRRHTPAQSLPLVVATTQVRSRLNGQILELMAANVTEALPRYCMPSAIARVEAKKVCAILHALLFRTLTTRP